MYCKQKTKKNIEKAKKSLYFFCILSRFVIEFIKLT
ncbi:MAG: hypothetical protein ACD_2C00190G0002 [uncultured bacterium (gcode 4)]|uniref:Uncharacterized protein n=1 Tax=uncultured bacterium (gcode 4) TaxID=1234023 RepID=K2GG20_9BACT|nr:MAG: hypothetical protein ACD_2C00190G0002 [uncultured bacterium (gcode 4)]